MLLMVSWKDKIPLTCKLFVRDISNGFKLMALDRGGRI